MRDMRLITQSWMKRISHRIQIKNQSWQKEANNESSMPDAVSAWGIHKRRWRYAAYIIHYRAFFKSCPDAGATARIRITTLNNVYVVTLETVRSGLDRKDARKQVPNEVVERYFFAPKSSLNFSTGITHYRHRSDEVPPPKPNNACSIPLSDPEVCRINGSEGDGIEPPGRGPASSCYSPNPEV